MTPEHVKLANIVSDAEAFGYLDPKYAEVMHGQLSELLDSVLRQLTLRQVEAAAATTEADMLRNEREAARIYLGERFFPVRTVSVDGTNGNPVEELRRAVTEVTDAVPFDRKIQRIKELRVNTHAADAWYAIQGQQVPGTSTPFGLKDAKDIIDQAERGVLWLGRQGSVPL